MNFDGTTYYGDYSLEDKLSQNIITYLKYGLLEVGGYYNVNRGTLDYNNNNPALLRKVGFAGSSGARIFQGLKNDWVWESGINPSYTGGSSPTNISGIYVNNQFIANNTAYSGINFHINYSLGQVEFDADIQSDARVEVNHTIRAVNVYSVDSVFYKNLIAYYQDRTNWDLAGSGIDNINNNYKAYLPAIFVNIDGYSSRSLEIGSRAKYAEANVEFDIFATNPQDRKRLSDYCYMLEEKGFLLFNPNTAPKPLTSSGTISNNAKTWPDLVSQYNYGQARFQGNARVHKNYNYLPIQYCKVSITLDTPVFTR